MKTDSVNLLQRLGDVCLDGERELLAAAKRVTNASAKARCKAAADRYAVAAAEIEDAIEDLGGYPLTTGTFAGVQRFALAKVKNIFVDDDDTTVILACERAEAFTESVYDIALNEELPETIASMLKRHYDGIRHDHQGMQKLRESLSRSLRAEAQPDSLTSRGHGDQIA